MTDTEIQLIVEKKEVVCEVTGEKTYVPRLREVEVEVVKKSDKEDDE